MSIESKTNISIERRALDHVDAGLAFEFLENWLATAEEYREIFALNLAGWVARYSANNNLGSMRRQLNIDELLSAAVRCILISAIPTAAAPWNLPKSLLPLIGLTGLQPWAALFFSDDTELFRASRRKFPLPHRQ